MSLQVKNDSQNKRRRGRPATGRGETIGVRIHPDQLIALDAYRGDLTRPEAIRRLIEVGLSLNEK